MQVRSAHLSDWTAIEKLSHNARRTTVAPWRWEEYLKDNRFFVTERDGRLVGAIFGCADESPVAWVRLAAVTDALNVDDWLDLTLPPFLKELRRRRASQLAWMDHQEWVESYLSARGFGLLTEVITLVKLDRSIPSPSASNARLRSASDEDFAAIEALDRAAFTPHWWRSEDTIRQGAAERSRFVVAELAGETVGYTEGKRRPEDAHLNRIAVHPNHQGRGIGALLLRDVLHAFWRMGADRVSLNTQADNHRARRLYRRFGFESTGDSAQVWTLEL